LIRIPSCRLLDLVTMNDAHSHGGLSVAVGDAFVDILTPIGEEMPKFGGDILARSAIKQLSGGSSCNTASHLASLTKDLGWQVHLFTATGNDSWKRIFEEQSSRSGFILHATCLDDVQTGVCLVLTGTQDRGFVTYNGAMQRFGAQHLDLQQLSKNDHVHFGGLFNIPEFWLSLPGVIRQLKLLNPSLTVSLDTNYDASQIWRHEWLLPILDLVDVFLPNDDEALGISATDTVDQALNVLSRYAKLVIVTLGDKGAKAKLSDSEEITHVPSPKVNVVDACGAGDAFNSAFLKIWLANGKQKSKLSECLRYAVRGGAFAVTNL